MSASAEQHRTGGVVNAMSVDVEDYFQVSAFDEVVARADWSRLESRVRDNTLRLLDLFDEFDVRGTFFVLGWVAEHDPSLVRDIAARGHEIASHGYGHRLLYTLTPDEFRADIRRARQTLQDASGCAVGGYRAPSFSVTNDSLWALDVLIEEGHWYDASIYPIHHDRYGLPGSPRAPYSIKRQSGTIAEMPGATVQLGPFTLPVGGGGYFRLLPYAWTKWGLGRLNHTEGEPAVFYIHPWEVDAAQPRLPAPPLSRFRHYRNLHLTAPRLRRLLADFQFAPVASVLQARSLGGGRTTLASLPDAS